LRQEEIGELVVLQKTEISKFKSKAKSARIEIILKVFKALKAEINFTINSKTIFLNLNDREDFRTHNNYVFPAEAGKISGLQSQP
jgi:hypothetical protein